TRQGCHPQASNRPTTGIEGKVITRALVIPARRHCPTISAVKVAFLRFGAGRLIPGMAFVNRVTKWVAINKGSLVLPARVVRMPKQNADAKIDIDPAGCQQLSVHEYTRCEERST